MALLLTSLIFYFPANLYPMMFTTNFGDRQGSTIMDGVILLWKMDANPIALVILTASIILPLTKMLILAHLLSGALYIDINYYPDKVDKLPVDNRQSLHNYPLFHHH
ncbi:MAG: paraquat-inducible protein A [Shewanella sp.]|nr:paraquat-inducible protein A [Shewanella sp.]MCF1431268.1 paraquat-inducible protein A [Shewanella sp.]MCF1437493.1 paraquat-inducible protein A [Shewanella sp.]MCF1459418.1 paraquat-inducible protein A [Shewanella sp.]